jgi:hypothetical protein
MPEPDRPEAHWPRASSRRAALAGGVAAALVGAGLATGCGGGAHRSGTMTHTPATQPTAGDEAGAGATAPRPAEPTAPVRARLEATPRAVLGALTPLRYSAPASKDASDRPAHVRAASAVRRFAGGLVMAQDDANFLALRRADGSISAIALPPRASGARTFSEAQGNKGEKMDLEAALTLPDGRLVAFGSGSRPSRRSIVVVTPALAVRVVDGAAFYGALEGRRDFVGSEINIEGAIHHGGVLRLFQRGNGATVDGQAALDATLDLPLDAFVAWLDGAGPLPPLGAARAFDLGTFDGVRLTFTDAVALPDGRVAILAAAEASPDTYHDGAVKGCRLGVIAGDEVHMYDLADAKGAACHVKLEGIELLEATAAGLRFFVVADVDDTAVPALGGELFLPAR